MVKANYRVCTISSMGYITSPLVAKYCTRRIMLANQYGCEAKLILHYSSAQCSCRPRGGGGWFCYQLQINKGYGYITKVA